jgi:hypothetical protein
VVNICMKIILRRAIRVLMILEHRLSISQMLINLYSEGKFLDCKIEYICTTGIKFEGGILMQVYIPGESKKTDTFVIHLNIKCISFF